MSDWDHQLAEGNLVSSAPQLGKGSEMGRQRYEIERAVDGDQMPLIARRQEGRRRYGPRPPPIRANDAGVEVAQGVGQAREVLGGRRDDHVEVPR